MALANEYVMKNAVANDDYRTCIESTDSPLDAYEKIGNVDGWWTLKSEGSALSCGGTFTVHFGEVYTTFEVTVAEPGRKLIWEVTDCNLPWLTNKKEWNGTHVVWEISSLGGKTNVTMTHDGLNESLECYPDCEKGWNHYILSSLKQYFDTGIGAPSICTSST